MVTSFWKRLVRVFAGRCGATVAGTDRSGPGIELRYRVMRNSSGAVVLTLYQDGASASLALDESDLASLITSLNYFLRSVRQAVVTGGGNC